MAKPEIDEELLLPTEEIRDIARAMLSAYHYANLPDWKFDIYLKEILAKANKGLLEFLLRENLLTKEGIDYANSNMP